jgi:hypothetical protein
MYLAIPLLHHPLIHGNKNEPTNGHFMCDTLITVNDFMNNNYTENILLINNNVNKEDIANYAHPIRNYLNVVGQPKVEIVMLERLKSGEDICIIKTHLIKQIQRKWRKIYTSKREQLNNN